MVLATGNTANESRWTSVSTGTLSNRIRNGRTGARRLDLPLVSDGAMPIDIIRRPSVTTPDAQVVLDQRFFDMASLRILLSDRAADITGLQTVTATAPIDLARLARDSGVPGRAGRHVGEQRPARPRGDLQRGQRLRLPGARRHADRRRIPEDRAPGPRRRVDRRDRRDSQSGLHGPQPGQHRDVEQRRHDVRRFGERRSPRHRRRHEHQPGHPAAACARQAIDLCVRHQWSLRSHEQRRHGRDVVQRADRLHPARALRPEGGCAAGRRDRRRPRPADGRRHALRRTRREQPEAVARHPRRHAGSDGLRRLLLRPSRQQEPRRRRGRRDARGPGRRPLRRGRLRHRRPGDRRVGVRGHHQPGERPERVERRARRWARTSTATGSWTPTAACRGCIRPPAAPTACRTTRVGSGAHAGVAGGPDRGPAWPPALGYQPNSVGRPQPTVSGPQGHRSRSPHRWR